VKRILKIVGLTLGGLVTLVLIVCLGIIINGTCFKTYNNHGIDNSAWMANLKDDVLINEIVMPGSHDAGSYKMVWLGETQQFTIDEQLQMGVRYFDIRVNKKEDKYVIFHSIINGVEFLPILDSIKTFITKNPTETLLLDFQHFEGNSQTDVYNFITEYLYNNNLLVVNDTDLSDLEFISNLKIKDARGKCIIFWGDRSSDLSNYTFLRNNDGCSRSDMSLNSYYISDYHYNDFDYLVEVAYPIYFENIKNKISNESKGIFVLQAQLTDGNLIFGPYSKEKTNDKRISEVIISFKDSTDLKYLNVIMRDFLDINKCEEIINLNNYKGNF
jgi:hypothetical protein